MQAMLKSSTNATPIRKPRRVISVFLHRDTTADIARLIVNRRSMLVAAIGLVGLDHARLDTRIGHYPNRGNKEVDGHGHDRHEER